MAVPKGKVSKARRDKRRASVWKAPEQALARCSHCGELMVPHRVCGSCGFYKNREVIKKEA